ncbi:membrane protein [Arthrobacter phage Qui]|uniref:Membrane protein n=1 Tax=Arthrobacter phage Qui TaxID=2603260 RepID=A0A5B8WH70_9CAUD|nr:membrane protein [Arthrobacter phage Qui]QED11651.1 membrane protein [Arthrobacter phage Qui]QOC56482.1 membrane protein [Arthrobacter phage Paella]
MKKVLIYGAGIVTGVVATPVAAIYIKPFRNALFTGCKKMMVFGAKHDPEYRADIVRDAEKIVDVFVQLKEADRNANL